MKNLLAAWILLAFVSHSNADDKKDAKPIAIDHVTIIDVTGGPALPEMTVVIDGGRIASVGKSGDMVIPEKADIINATGKFLIPGLWDMHVHMPAPSYLPLFLANGVTGIREMHAFFPAMILKMRQDIQEGKLLGPRMVAAGAIIDGPKPFWPGSLPAANEEEGRKAVQALKKQGADFIKVYTKLPRPAYLAIADEAKKQGLSFVGHVPESISAAEASDLGQKSMEHLFGILLACSSEEEKLRQEELEAMAKLDNAAIRPLMARTWIKALDTYNEEKAGALFAKFVKNGTWQDPTLTVLRSLASLEDAQFTNDPRLKYMPPFLRAGWPKADPSKPPSEAAASMKRTYQKASQLVTAMHKAGVRFLAGTDVTNPYCFPGFSLHDELGLLVSEAKFTPLEALQCATLNPAIFLGLEKEFGTVEKGKIADMVLLDANPLDDIKNTQKITAVFAAGKYLRKNELEKMLKDAETGNAK
jgi:imidazolonepropionase-like amidohydrolase